MASEGNKYPHMGHLGCCWAGTTGSMEWGDSLADVAHTPLAASKIFDFILSSLVSLSFVFVRLLLRFSLQSTLISILLRDPRFRHTSWTKSWTTVEHSILTIAE